MSVNISRAQIENLPAPVLVAQKIENEVRCVSMDMYFFNIDDGFTQMTCFFKTALQDQQFSRADSGQESECIPKYVLSLIFLIKATIGNIQCKFFLVMIRLCAAVENTIEPLLY